MSEQTKSKKTGQNSHRPTNQRYKSGDRLRKNKVRRIVKHNKLPEAIARRCWENGEQFPRAIVFGVETATAMRYAARRAAKVSDT